MRETYQPPAASPAGPPHDRTPEETSPPTVYRIRHNVTESDEPQRKLVRARARGNRPPYAGGDTEPACPHAQRPLPSFPRRRESFLPTWIAQATACRTYPLELPSPIRHVNISNGSRQTMSTQRSV